MVDTLKRCIEMDESRTRAGSTGDMRAARCARQLLAQPTTDATAFWSRRVRHRLCSRATTLRAAGPMMTTASTADCASFGAGYTLTMTVMQHWGAGSEQIQIRKQAVCRHAPERRRTPIPPDWDPLRTAQTERRI
jgi:hypothetical protein